MTTVPEASKQSPDAEPPVDDAAFPAQGSTKDYCERWPVDGHSFVAIKPAGASLSVRQCRSCGWVDGEDLERQITERVGICGDQTRFGVLPGAPTALICDLPAGHDGWHGAETGAVHPAGYVPSRCSWTVDVVGGLPQESTGHPESRCHRCGGPNVQWVAPSPLWNTVIRGGSIDGDEEFDGIVCPTCFAVLAEQSGVARSWRLAAEVVTANLDLVTPSGRVWDSQRWLWREAVS